MFSLLFAGGVAAPIRALEIAALRKYDALEVHYPFPSFVRNPVSNREGLARDVSDSPLIKRVSSAIYETFRREDRAGDDFREFATLTCLPSVRSP